MENADSDFLRLFKGYELPKLEAHSGTVYGVWSDGRIAYMNPAWFRFAAENAGTRITQEWGLGANLMKALPAELLKFYRGGYTDCLENHRPWSHDYECSSATQYRRFHQVVYPVGQGEGLLMVNSLIVEHLHDPLARPPCAADDAAYRDDNGFLQQCSHCRMIRRQNPVEHWDWVPEWVRCPQGNTSHTLCPSCLGYYMAQIS